jgi:hypothetical protein
MWNGIKLFSRTSFAWRQTFLRQVLSCMHTPCPGFESRVVELRSDAMAGIRGYEHYTDRIGETGLFKAEAEVKAEDMYEITATDVPDVYKLEKDLGYLRVRTLELSRTLRTLGPTFRLQCVKNPENDGTWSPVMK